MSCAGASAWETPHAGDDQSGGGGVAQAHGEAIRPRSSTAQEMALVGDGGSGGFRRRGKFYIGLTLANTYAADWARTYGGQLITNMDATTKARIGEVGRGPRRGGVSRPVEAHPGDYRRPMARGRWIAQTEPTSAWRRWNGGLAAGRGRAGCGHREVWNTANDDLVCPTRPAESQQKRISRQRSRRHRTPGGASTMQVLADGDDGVDQSGISAVSTADTVSRFRRAADAGFEIGSPRRRLICSFRNSKVAGVEARGLSVSVKVPGAPGEYPGKSAGKMTFVSDKQRRFFFAALREGTIQVPYRRTGTLGRKWTSKVTFTDDDVMGFVGNNTPYAPLVQGFDTQARIHAGNWQTEQDVANESRDEIMGIFADEISRAMASE